MKYQTGEGVSVLVMFWSPALCCYLILYDLHGMSPIHVVCIQGFGGRVGWGPQTLSETHSLSIIDLDLTWNQDPTCQGWALPVRLYPTCQTCTLPVRTGVYLSENQNPPPPRNKILLLLPKKIPGPGNHVVHPPATRGPHESSVRSCPAMKISVKYLEEEIYESRHRV